MEYNLCECLKELKDLGLVAQYSEKEHLPITYDISPKEGELCLVSNQFNSSWHEYDDFVYPISYCPICGKKLELKKDIELIRIRK